MFFAFVEAAKTVGAEGLHDANVDVGVIKVQEGGTIEIEETGEAVEIMIEQLLAQIGRQVGLGVKQKRGNIVLQRAFAAALIVEKKGKAITQHDVAGLEIAIEKKIAAGVEEEFRGAAEVIFERLLVEGDAGQAQEIILEIIQIPRYRLAIETGARIADLVIQIATGLDLKARQQGYHLAICRDGFGSDGRSLTIVREEFKQSGIAKIFFQIGALALSFPINLGHGEGVAAKVAGEFEEGKVFFADVVENADGTELSARETDDFAARPAQLALQRLHPLDRLLEMALKESFQNFHVRSVGRLVAVIKITFGIAA